MSVAEVEVEGNATEEQMSGDDLDFALGINTGGSPFDVDPNAEQEESGEPEQSAEQEGDEEATEEVDELTKIREELKALQESNRKYQLTIDRQGDELGQLRKLKEQPQEEESADDYLQKFAEDPEKAVEATFKKQLEAEQARRTQEQQVLAQNRDVIHGKVDGFENLIPDIKKDFLAEGASEDVLASLDYELYLNPTLAVYAGKAVKMAKENSELRAQLEEARKQPHEFAKKLQKATSKGPSLNGKISSSKQGNSRKMTGGDLTSLSDEELSRMLEEAS